MDVDIVKQEPTTRHALIIDQSVHVSRMELQLIKNCSTPVKGMPELGYDKNSVTKLQGVTVDSNWYTNKALWSFMVLVVQDPDLLSRTVKGEIAYTKKNAPEFGIIMTELNSHKDSNNNLSFELKHGRNSSKLSAAGSTITESTQAGDLINGSVGGAILLPSGVSIDQMGLLVEQVIMRAGEMAVNSSTVVELQSWNFIAASASIKSLGAGPDGKIIGVGAAMKASQNLAFVTTLDGALKVGTLWIYYFDIIDVAISFKWIQAEWGSHLNGVMEALAVKTTFLEYEDKEAEINILQQQLHRKNPTAKEITKIVADDLDGQLTIDGQEAFESSMSSLMILPKALLSLAASSRLVEVDVGMGIAAAIGNVKLKKKTFGSHWESLWYASPPTIDVNTDEGIEKKAMEKKGEQQLAGLKEVSKQLQYETTNCCGLHCCNNAQVFVFDTCD